MNCIFGEPRVGVAISTQGFCPPADVHEVWPHVAALVMRRDVFETMIGKKTVGRFGGQGIQFYGFFARRPQDAAVAHIAEDRSFYRRWQHDCGGEVWALADAQIMHIGDFMYGGSYTDVPSSHQTTV